MTTTASSATLTVADRVNAGAAYLDDRQPGWEDKINLSWLVMTSCKACVLGQVYGGYWAAPPLDGLDELLEADQWAIDHGFQALLVEGDRHGLHDDDDYQALQVAWTAEIQRRRGLQQDIP